MDKGFVLLGMYNLDWYSYEWQLEHVSISVHQWHYILFKKSCTIYQRSKYVVDISFCERSLLNMCFHGVTEIFFRV